MPKVGQPTCRVCQIVLSKMLGWLHTARVICCTRTQGSMTAAPARHDAFSVKRAWSEACFASASPVCVSNMPGSAEALRLVCLTRRSLIKSSSFSGTSSGSSGSPPHFVTHQMGPDGPPQPLSKQGGGSLHTQPLTPGGSTGAQSPLTFSDCPNLHHLSPLWSEVPSSTPRYVRTPFLFQTNQGALQEMGDPHFRLYRPKLTLCVCVCVCVCVCAPPFNEQTRLVCTQSNDQT